METRRDEDRGPRCESGWTGGRCQLPLHHEGPHDNEERTYAVAAEVETLIEEIGDEGAALYEVTAKYDPDSGVLEDVLDGESPDTLRKVRDGLGAALAALDKAGIR